MDSCEFALPLNTFNLVDMFLFQLSRIALEQEGADWDDDAAPVVIKDVIQLAPMLRVGSSMAFL